MIMRRIPGIPGYQANLTGAQKERVLEQLGHHLACIHSIKRPGFGVLIAQGASFAGGSPTLWDYVRDDYACRIQALPSEVLSRQQAEELWVRLERERAAFTVESGSLLHGDYHLKNVLVQGAQVTGIVDFETLMVGDPVADFRALYHWSHQSDAELRAVQRGYGRPDLFDGDFMKKLLLYELLLELEVLWWKH